MDAASHYLDETIARVRREDPRAAIELDDLRKQRDQRAVAATLLQSEQSNGMAGVKDVGDKIAGKQTVAELELAMLAMDPKLIEDPADREAFVTSHAALMNVLKVDATSELSREYFAYLREASKSPEVWRVVRDDPVALFVFRDVQNAELRDFYVRERDWLSDILCQFQGLPQEHSGIEDLIKTAQKYHPLTKQAVASPEEFGGLGLGLEAFQIFLTCGDVIQECVREFRLPLEQVLEVLYANGDTVSDRLVVQNQNPQEVARFLADLYKSQPESWDAARRYSLVLRLMSDVPQHAGKVLKEHRHDDIASFLYSAYEEEIVPATRAVDFYGDLAIYELGKYSEDKRFRELLRDNQVGARLIPYVVRFGDEGIDKLGDNTAWLDKHFDANGKEKGPEWWQAVPIVGAPANVIRNWSTGIPNEWSEVGWAGLDAVDGVLLVASFGGTTIIKEGGEAVAKQAVKRTAIQSGRAAASAASKGARSAAAKLAAKVGGESLLKRAIQFAARAGGAIKATAMYGGRIWSATGGRVVHAAQAAVGAWSKVPPNIRRWTYRGLLAAGLFITLKERTVPILIRIKDEIIKKIASYPEELAKTLIEPLKRFLGPALPPGVIAWLKFLLPLTALVGICWITLPWKRRWKYV